MLLKNRSKVFTQPDRSAQKIYIFCEGKDREYKYFKFFEGMDSRLNLIIYELKGAEDNSPNGLFQLACQCLKKTSDNPNPMYDYRTDDLVWIVLDTDQDKFDSRKAALMRVRAQCEEENWKVAQSNPCFEVWLYYHQESDKPVFDEIHVPAKWKQLVNKVIKGGFDSRKHQKWIGQAIANSKQHFQRNEDGFPDIATTEVFKLAEHILSIGKIQAIITGQLS